MDDKNETMKKIPIEILGWYGTSAIILGYVLVSFHAVSSDSVLYQLLNLTGALGIVAISIMKKAEQPAVLNIFWAIIAAAALIRFAVS